MNKFKVVYTDNYVKKKGLASRYGYIFGQTEDSALADASISRVNITGIYAIQPLEEAPVESLEESDPAPEQKLLVPAALLVDTPDANIPAVGSEEVVAVGTVAGAEEGPVNEPASEQPDEPAGQVDEPALFDGGQAEAAEVPVPDMVEAHDDLSRANAGDLGGGGEEQ